MFFLAQPVFKQNENILFNIESLSYDLLQLELDTGLKIDDLEILRGIFDCITVQVSAKAKVEEFCTDLLNKHCYGSPYPEFLDILSFIRSYGDLFIERITFLGLYKNGQFPYKLSSKRANILVLTRKDVYYNLIKQEINCYHV